MEITKQTSDDLPVTRAQLGRITATLALAAAFLITLGVAWNLVFTVPKYESIFAEFNARLPAATVSGIHVSHLCRDLWFLIGPVVLAVYLALTLLTWKTKSWRAALWLCASLAVLSYVAYRLLAMSVAEPFNSLVRSARRG